jgi:hypothetical protein
LPNFPEITTIKEVIATGSSFKSDMPFKSLSSTEEAKKALHDWAERINSAESIVVVGSPPHSPLVTIVRRSRRRCSVLP